MHLTLSSNTVGLQLPFVILDIGREGRTVVYWSSRVLPFELHLPFHRTLLHFDLLW